MRRKRDKLGKSQQQKAATFVRRSPRTSPGGLITSTKNQSTKNQNKDCNENVVFASVAPLGRTENSLPLELQQSGTVAETSSAEWDQNAGDAIESEGKAADCAAGVAEKEHSKKLLVVYEDSVDDAATAQNISGR